jgi:hypothetical protein
MRFQFLNFNFCNVGLRLTNGEIVNSCEQMLLVGAKKKVNVRPKKAAEPFSNGS